MDFKRPKGRPEAKGARRLVLYMEARGWVCDKLGGSKYASGWPDFWCFHPKFGERWVETKAPGGKLRPSQIKRFTRWAKHGIKIYVLEDEKHYQRLFGQEDNWRRYTGW